jgi:RNA polymerase sigma-70 factor (ECF subfamily)
MIFRVLKANYKSITDEDIMLAIQHGECQAFDELYLRYNERLYYYFYRMLGYEHSIAQDFMHDLFLKIIQKPMLFDAKKSFKTWIFSCANNMCKNEYRNKQVRSVVHNVENPDKYLDDIQPIENQDKLMDTIFKELNKFDESHKTAFLLKYREGFTIEEISEIMELPEGTVKSRLFYTRKKLQQQVTQIIKN